MRQPKFCERVNIGASDAAVLDVAENCDVQIFDRAEAVANGERIEKTLRGMFVRAITGIDHRNFKISRDKICGARGAVAHHDAIGLHRIESVNGIQKRLAFFQAGRFGLQVHAVCAEARGCGGETDAGASGRLEEC